MSALLSPIILKALPQPLATHAVCLTFDDGPDPKYTPAMLDILARYNVHANFFVVGEAAKKFPSLVQRMLAAGHVVGNHTYNHFHPWLISSSRAQREVTQASEVISAITGEAPRWFRPPHGRLRQAMIDQASSDKMTTVLWSLSAVDWGPRGNSKNVASQLQKIKCGDILLMHDGARRHNHPDVTLQQLPGLITRLLQNGISLITLDQIHSIT